MWQNIEDKQQWNSLVEAQKNSRFLQSWEWGEFQKFWNRKVVRLSWENKLLVQAIKMPLPFGKSYWYVPHAPVIASNTEDAFIAMSELSNELAKHGALFMRVDPIARLEPPTEKEKTERAERPLQFIPTTQPHCTRILDLSLSDLSSVASAKGEEELLSQMHQKTRYNIRLAEKKGVSIKEGNVSDFLKLNNQTTERDKFVSHPDSYYQKMSELLPDNFIKIWSAEYEGKILSSNIVLYFGDTATYTHGTSSNENRELMAPHLLQWEIIKHAKSKGFKNYDFYGVNPEDEEHSGYKKSWQGISRFKAGFGGKLICYPKSFDLIYNNSWYSLYRLTQKLRRIF
jgi:peptidoglycan pentaglycine glycine transferase (the first glycine)